MFYILHHRKCFKTDDIFEWYKFIAKGFCVRKVRRTFISDRIFISTIFLGVDYSIPLPGFESTPLLFETMISIDHTYIDYQTRCTTWRQALAMHQLAIKSIKELPHGPP